MTITKRRVALSRRAAPLQNQVEQPLDGELKLVDIGEFIGNVAPRAFPSEHDRGRIAV